MIIEHFLSWMQTATVPKRAQAVGALARAYLYSDMSYDNQVTAESAMTVLLEDPSSCVRFALAESVLEISANNPDMGEASEEISVAYDGPKLEVGFNARYLIDVLSVLPEGSEVTLGLGDELSPGIVSGDDSTYTYVVMPLRI